MSLLYFIAVPLLASFLTPFYKQHLRLVSLAVQGILLALTLCFYTALPIKEFVSFASPLSIVFLADSTALFFVTLFAAVMFFFALYHIKEENRTDIFVVTNIFTAGVMGLILSGDIFNLYIFFEITSISAYIMTALNRDQKGYAGAIKYMIVGAIASIFLLLAVMLLYLSLGYLTLESIADGFHTIDRNMQNLILLLLFIGFGIKAEIFPLNFWVADIYQAAPTRIAALFSAVLSKAYLFVFFHLLYTFGAEISSLTFLLSLGLISFAIAELSALRSNDVKRIFAYSTLGQLGVLFLAFSSGNTVIVSGAIFLILVHALSKLMLFFSLDLVEQKMHSTRIDAFSAFQSPFLFGIFVIGFLSILGIPPFGGFIAKLTILKGFASLGNSWVVGLVLGISLIEATYFFRLLSTHLKSKKSAEIHPSMLQKLLLSLLALILVYLGVFPEDFLAFATQAAQTFIQGVPHV